MTVSSDDARSGPYNGNASTTVFAYDFKILDQAHLVVTLTSSAGVESVKTLTTHYTVSGVGGASGGNVTMVTAPASGEKLTITRSVPLTQLIDLQNRGGTQPSVLESAYDKLTQIVQDFNELYARVPRFPVSSAETSVELPLTLTADAVLKVNAAGDGFENGPTTTQISDAETQATAAAASAVAAAASETAAGVSETNAAASAVTASSYASPVTDLFTAGVDFTAGSSTTITLSGSGLSEDAVMITFDGVVQHHDTYSISGTTVTFTSTIPVGVLAIEASYGTRSTGAIDNVAIGANTPSTGAFTTINGVTPATAQYTTTLNTKLNNIEALADVTDATNVTAAGALMDSELTSIASVKALNQGLATTDSPSFVNVTSNLTGDITGNAATVTTNANLTGDVTSVGNATTIGATKVVESMLSAAVQTKLNNTAPSKFDATAAPTANSDSANTDTNGTFAVGSVWIDVTGNEAYRCVDDTPTAAIWISTTLTTSELGTMATQNANAVAITGGAISGATLDGVLGSNTPAAASVTTLTASGDVAINTDTLLVDVSTETIGVKMTPDVLGAPLQIKHDGTVAYLGLDGGNSDTAPFLSTWQDPDPASALFGWSFFNRSTDGNLRLSRRNNSTTDTEVLTIARSTGNATFAGTLSAQATDVTTLTATGTISQDATATGDIAYFKTTGNSGTGLFINSNTTSQIDLVGWDGSDANAINLRSGGSPGNGILLDTSNNVTLSGTLSAGATDVTTLTASGTTPIIRTTDTRTSTTTGDDLGGYEIYTNDADGPHIAAYFKADSFSTFGRVGTLRLGISQTVNTDAVDFLTANNTGMSVTLPTTFDSTLSAGATTVTTLTASGNAAINTTLPTINTVDGALLVGSQGSIMCFSNEVDVGHNFYYNSGWKYRTTATASLLTMGNSGVPFLFLYTASGTADTAITWSEAGRIDASGNWNFQAKSLTTTGTLSAGATNVTGILDVAQGNVTGSTASMLVGADANTTSRTDATNKFFTLGGAHYTNAEQPIALMSYSSTSSATALYIGAQPNGTFNVPTEIQLRTGASVTATGGTAALTLDSSQNATFANAVNLSGWGSIGVYDTHSTITTEAAAAGGSDKDFRVKTTGGNVDHFLIAATTGNATFAGTLSAGLITVNAANKTNADEVGTITLASTDAYAIDKGGSIGFKGLYSSGGGVAIFGRIYGAKETAADGNFQGYLGFAVASGGSPAEKMRLNSDGTLDIAAGVYIGGTAAANLLDDYEEGTWTPVISGDGTAGTYTNGTTQATYTKIGRMVTVNFGIGSFSTATGGTGNLRITGLPFTKTAGQSPTGSVWFSSVNTGASVISLALVFSTAAGASATLNVNEVVDNAVVQLTPISGVGVSSQIHGSITYFV